MPFMTVTHPCFWDEEWLALFEVWQRVYPDRNMGHCMAEALERVLPGRAAAK